MVWFSKPLSLPPKYRRFLVILCPVPLKRSIFDRYDAHASESSEMNFTRPCQKPNSSQRIPLCAWIDGVSNTIKAAARTSAVRFLCRPSHCPMRKASDQAMAKVGGHGRHQHSVKGGSGSRLKLCLCEPFQQSDGNTGRRCRWGNLLRAKTCTNPNLREWS